jgi:choline dehydrogenase
MYDYVIVGAGSAGCVLAARLTEDSGTRVALLEAGGPDSAKEVHIPLAFAKLFKTPRDWDYATDAQAELADRELYWPRGKMLGGSSSMNAMMWVRGHHSDYDDWDLPGWSYKDVEPYFKKAEHRSGSNHNDTYGTEGPLWISELRAPNEATKAFLAACSSAGLTRLDELNGPDNGGFSATPVTQRKGRRWSAADGYLNPAKKRPNLTILTGAHVQRIVIDEGRATGVVYTDEHGATQQLEAGKEVILSAGAIGSPQLLMLSGVGDPDHLREVGVEVVAERPAVGRDLQDHLASAITVTSPKEVTLAGAESLANLGRYLFAKSGPLTSNVGEAVAFIRSDPDLAAPDLELVWAPGPFINHGLEPPTGHGVTIGVVLLQPDSRGRVSLRSTDPSDAPHLDPAYLTVQTDLLRLRLGLRFAEQLLMTEPLKPYAAGPMAPWPGKVDDDELETYIREHSETLYHPSGTCRMGADEDSVVDPALKVRGVEGLRVVDVSVMPRINRGHTHAPAIMIAERAADLIRT